MFIFESKELKTNPCNGFREGGFKIFCKENTILVLAGQSKLGQILVIFTFVLETIVNVDETSIP